MKLNYILYLKNILGEEETKKYIKANEYRTSLLIDVLKDTPIKNILDEVTLEDFCHCLTFGCYGLVLAKNLPLFSKENHSVDEYKKLVEKFTNNGYISEEKYLDLFEYLKEISEVFNNKKIKTKVIKEIKEENNKGIKVSEFLEKGGSLTELISFLSENKIFEFGRNTRIPLNNVNELNKFEFSISLSELEAIKIHLNTIGQNIHLNALDITNNNTLLKKYFDNNKIKYYDTSIEFHEIYKECLLENKHTSNTTFTISHKPNLYEYLRKIGVLHPITNSKKKILKN